MIYSCGYYKIADESDPCIGGVENHSMNLAIMFSTGTAGGMRLAAASVLLSLRVQ
jgi:hypothetical protein